MNADASALEMAPILQALDPACDEIALTLPARQKYMISFPQVSMIRISQTKISHEILRQSSMLQRVSLQVTHVAFEPCLQNQKRLT